MTDYSKPTGWWCERLREPHRRKLCPWCIPVFTIIPESMRPEAGEPDAHAVCTFVDDLHCYSDKTTRGRFANAGLVGWLCSRGAVAIALKRRAVAVPSTADAVLWVAEGRLPTGVWR